MDPIWGDWGPSMGRMGAIHHSPSQVRALSRPKQLVTGRENPVRKLLLVVLVAFLPFLTSAAWAGEDLTSMTNADRTAAGLGALATASDLQSFAQRRAEEMARANKLWHTSSLGTQVANWQRVGENVGR